MSSTGSRGDVAVAVGAPRATLGATSRRPVIGWAVVGAVCSVVAVGVYLRWLLGGDAVAVGPGPDPMTDGTVRAALAFQNAVPALAVLTIVVLVRRCRAERRLTLDAMIAIGWVLSWWHDPLINWQQPAVLYNASLVNLGSWVAHVPFWSNGAAAGLPEPVLVIGAIYVWLGLGFGVIGAAAMRRARHRRPSLGTAATVLVGFVAVFAVEVVVELIAIRTELVAYPSAIAALTLWAGKTHQVPLYAQALWSMTLTATAALRFFVDEQSRSVVERGAESATRSGRATALRLLAVIGFVHVAALAYDATMNATVPFAGPTEAYPTYFRGDRCGDGTGVACP